MIGSDPSLVVLAGVLKALRESPLMEEAFAVESADSPPVVRIYDDPPAAPGGEGATGDEGFPFGRIDFIEMNSVESVLIEEEHSGESDGVLDDPSEGFIGLSFFSRPRGEDATLGGKPEAMRLCKAARKVLAGGEIVLEADEDGGTFRIVLAHDAGSRHFTDPDGVTAHSVLTVRFEIEPSEG